MRTQSPSVSEGVLSAKRSDAANRSVKSRYGSLSKEEKSARGSESGQGQSTSPLHSPKAGVTLWFAGASPLTVSMSAMWYFLDLMSLRIGVATPKKGSSAKGVGASSRRPALC